MSTDVAPDPAFIGANCLCLHTRRAARALARRYDEALAPVELTNGQFTLLAMLAGQPDVGMQALADSMGVDRTTLTAALKPLARRRLVVTETDENDARARRLQVTRAGAALLRKAIPLWHRAQQAAIERVGLNDVSRLREDLSRLL